jgi:hypothetical protein
MESNTGILYLEVNAGLCNRIRALVSGICWARHVGRKLVVCWPSFKPECIAGFYDLFAESSLPADVIIVDDILSQRSTCLSSGDAVRFIENVPKDQPVSIISHGCFWAYDKELWLTHLRNLQPSLAVISILATWNLKGLRELDTAIHIRRTDNTRAIELSPFSLFVETIQKRPNERFALFTDDPTAADMLKLQFGDRILTFESFRKRVSKDGMIEAAAVFFSLAARKRILGSAYSSFSEIARDYGNNTLELVRYP